MCRRRDGRRGFGSLGCARVAFECATARVCACERVSMNVRDTAPHTCRRTRTRDVAKMKNDDDERDDDDDGNAGAHQTGRNASHNGTHTCSYTHTTTRLLYIVFARVALARTRIGFKESHARTPRTHTHAHTSRGAISYRTHSRCEYDGLTCVVSVRPNLGDGGFALVGARRQKLTGRRCVCARLVVIHLLLTFVPFRWQRARVSLS